MCVREAGEEAREKMEGAAGKKNRVRTGDFDYLWSGGGGRKKLDCAGGDVLPIMKLCVKDTAKKLGRFFNPK